MFHPITSIFLAMWFSTRIFFLFSIFQSLPLHPLPLSRCLFRLTNLWILHMLLVCCLVMVKVQDHMHESTTRPPSGLRTSASDPPGPCSSKLGWASRPPVDGFSLPTRSPVPPMPARSPMPSTPAHVCSPCDDNSMPLFMTCSSSDPGTSPSSTSSEPAVVVDSSTAVVPVATRIHTRSRSGIFHPQRAYRRYRCMADRLHGAGSF
jgi:hypothetical protein